MSDTNTTTNQDKASIPVKALTKNDEQGNPIVSITPQLLVIGRGQAEDNVYPAIVVTKENLNDYVKFRGLDSVLDTLNSKERLDAQAALDYVLTDEDWEETGKTDAKGKPKFAYITEKFLAVIDKFWETLSSGKVRGGVTIDSLETEQADLFTEMQRKIGEMVKAAPDEARKIMLEANALSIKHQEISAQIEEIRKARKPRMTKAEKAEAAAKAAALKASQAAPTAA